MHNSKEGIDAHIDHKKQYKVYLLNKLCSYFGVSKSDMQQDVDTTEDILTFPMLYDRYNFNARCYTGFISRKKLNLDIFLDTRKFAKTTILEAFLIGESMVDSLHIDDYVFCFHIGAMLLVMFRGESIEEDAGIVIHIENEGDFIICRIENYLHTRWPKIED